MNVKRISAGIASLALAGGLAACGSSSGGSTSGNQAPVSMATWWNASGSQEIQTVNQDLETVSNDQNYGQDPMSDAEQLATDAQTGLNSPPPVDAADFTGWLNDVIQVAQFAEDGLPMTPEVLQINNDGAQHIQAFAKVAATYGLLLPGESAPAAAPADSANQAPADTQAPAPADSTPAAAAPVAPPATTPPPAVRPVFDCYVNDNSMVPYGGGSYGASINIHPGTGNGYSQAVVRVTIADKYGHALQTQTVTATDTEANPTWQVVIDPEGGPPSLATESSCTATVESSS